MTTQEQILANKHARETAETVIAMLQESLSPPQYAIAARVLRKEADRVLGKPNSLSKMDETEAKAFLASECMYAAYKGERWRNIPLEYIQTIADFGLQLQRYLRSDVGENHPRRSS